MAAASADTDVLAAGLAAVPDHRRFPLRYDPLYWGAVFPLGMYTVCTFRLAGMIEEPALRIVPRVFLYVALTAWTLAFVGLLGSLAKKS